MPGSLGPEGVVVEAEKGLERTTEDDLVFECECKICFVERVDWAVESRDEVVEELGVIAVGEVVIGAVDVEDGEASDVCDFGINIGLFVRAIARVVARERNEEWEVNDWISTLGVTK